MVTPTKTRRRRAKATAAAAPTIPPPAALKADAKNRAWRTFLQGLGIDMGVAVAIVVYQVATQAGAIVWAVAAASLARSCAQAGASYVMRRFLDPSKKIPTPLPPDEHA